VIEERGLGLKKFVENYRKFTKLPDPDLQKVELTQLIRNVLLVCTGFDNYHKVKVEESLPDPIIAITDDDLLSQVLINLIKNALENFSEKGSFDNSVIQVKVSVIANRIKIDICNNGEEIPPELREQIFVPFFTTKENGSGIGLSLSKQIMLILGGDIILRTDNRNFTCFTVSLPH
jgi:signal transduction histidine kinase